jgi:ribose/xylose/arabinose/galactoside ABC-type transport system permease subunit
MGTNITITKDQGSSLSLGKLWKVAVRRREFVLVVMIILMIIFLSSVSPAFLSYRNMMALASNEAVKGFVLIGVLFLLITRDFDLSVGSGIALVGIVMAWTITKSGNLALGLVAGLAIGLLLGFINGFLVTKLKMASFIATLGTLYMARSLCNVISNGKAIPVQNKFIVDLFNSYVLGLPSVFIWMIVFAIIMAIFLSKEKHFVRLYFTGVNERGAKMVGINSDKLRWLAFIFSGLMIAVAGIIYTGMLRAMEPTAFKGLEMKLIAMCVIGGGSLKGGQGSVVGAILGMLLVTLIGNSMTLIGISPQWEGTILGSILVAAAILDVMVQKKVE